MRKLFIAVFLALTSAICTAQTEGISYQAVIIDNKVQEIPGINIANNYLIEEEVDLKFTIFDAYQAIEFQEIHRTITDRFGLVNVIIGRGIPTSDSPKAFDEINWDGTQKQLLVEVSFRGSVFFMLGKQDLLFVPYGYHRDIYAAGSLTVDGPATINNTFTVTGQNPTFLGGDLYVGGTANFEGNTNFQTITVHDWSLLHGTLQVHDSTNISAPFFVNDGEPSKLSGTLDVDGTAIFNNELSVLNQSPVSLTGALQVDGNTSLNSSLSVLNQSPAFLTGRLDVNGSTDLYDSLTVRNESPAYFSGTMTVNQSTTLNDSLMVLNESPVYFTGTLEVDESTKLNDSLTVLNESPVYFTGTLEVDQSTKLNGSLSVLNESPAYLTGTLSVDLSTRLNDSLTVANQAPSRLSGTLMVDGSASLMDSLSVLNGSPTLLTGVLDVLDNTQLHNSLAVLNESPAMLSGALFVEGISQFNDDITVNARSQLNGQVTVISSLAGDQASFDAYPLRVQGSNNGIAIKVTNVKPDNSNNFITFFNSNNEAVGRIEGETPAEKLISFDYIYETAKLGTEIVLAAADLVAASTSSTACIGLGACVTVPVPSLIIAAVAKTAIAATNLIAYEVFAYCCIGVTYESGSADYAEWLERAIPEERMTYGDIVSVKGGKITKNTTYGDQMMVISYKPAVLGNMPAEGENHKYEMVAFLGQVPVKIIGKAKIGDYILPSGFNDGFGRAVDPSEMKIEEYPRIVGVAWSASDDEISSYVNVAIGMNRNDMVKIVKEQQSEIDRLKNRLDERDALLSELLPGYAERIAQKKSDVLVAAPRADALAQKSLSAEEMHAPLSRATFEAGFEEAKIQLGIMGIDANTHPLYSKIFNDPEAREKVIDQAMKIFEAQRIRAAEIDKAAGY